MSARDTHAPRTGSIVYHVVARAELRAGLADDSYRPQRLAIDGFVHCADSVDSTLAVVRDYFSTVADDIVVLSIDAGRLRAKLVFEPPAPIAGGGTTHLTTPKLWPHIYGPVERAAIDGVGVVRRNGAAEAIWPPALVALDTFLSEP